MIILQIKVINKIVIANIVTQMLFTFLEVSITEQKVKVEASSQVASLPSKPVVEEAIVEQRIKATMSAPLQPAANKKRNPKAKASEEFDGAYN